MFPFMRDRGVEVVKYITPDGRREKQLQYVRKSSRKSYSGPSNALVLHDTPEFYPSASHRQVKDTFQPSEGEDLNAFRQDGGRPGPNFHPLPRPIIHQNYQPLQNQIDHHQSPFQAIEEPHEGWANNEPNQPGEIVLAPDHHSRKGRVTRVHQSQRRRSHHRNRSREPKYCYSSSDSHSSGSPRRRYLEAADEWEGRPLRLAGSPSEFDEWEYARRKNTPRVSEGGWGRPRQYHH